MKEFVERIEELLLLQEKLVNLMLLSGSRKLSLSVSSAFDVLYYNVELLDLIGEVLSAYEGYQEEYGKEYLLNLSAEALSWMGVLLPAIEDVCPIFLREEPIRDIMNLLQALERLLRGEPYPISPIAQGVQNLSSLLKHQIYLARRSYLNLA